MTPTEQRKQALAAISEHERILAELADVAGRITELAHQADTLSDHQPPVVVGKRRWGRGHRIEDGPDPTLLEIANLLAERSELETLRSRLETQLAETEGCREALQTAEAACLTLWRSSEPERAAGIDTRDARLVEISAELTECDFQAQVAADVLAAASTAAAAMSAATSRAFENAFSPDGGGSDSELNATAILAVEQMREVCRRCDDEAISERVAEFYLGADPQLAELVDVNDAAKVLLSLARGLAFRVSERRHTLCAAKRAALGEREALFRNP